MESSKLALFFTFVSLTLSQTLIKAPMAIAVPQKNCTTLLIKVPGNPGNLTLTLQVGAVPTDFNVSRKQIEFTTSDETQDIVLCSRTDAPMKSFPITMSLEGPSRQNYKLTNGGAMMVNVIAKISNGTPAVSIRSGSSTRTSASYSIETSGDGNLYYAVWDSRLRQDSYDFVTVKLRAQSLTGSLNQASWIGLAPQDFWANYVMTRASIASISFDGLTPATSYTMCLYY